MAATKVIIASAYGIPSCVLYVMVMVAIEKEKQHLNRTFFQIVQVSAALNVCVFVNTFVHIRLPNLVSPDSWLGRFYIESYPDFLARLEHGLVIYFAYAQMMMISLMSLNRMTSVISFYGHLLLCRHMSKVIAVALLLCALPAIRVVLLPSAFKYDPKQEQIILSALDPSIIYTYRIMCYYMVFITTATLFMNVVIIIGMNLLRLDKAQQLISDIVKLTLINFVIMLILTVFTNMVIVARTDDAALDDFIHTGLPFVSDLITLADPYLLLLLNRRLRSRVLNSVKRTVSTTVTTL